MKVIGYTENYQLLQDEELNTIIIDCNTNKESTWKVDLEARDEINYIKHMDNIEFDEYCKKRLRPVCL